MSSTTFSTRLASAGSTVGTPLIVRDTVAVDTLARLAISRMSIALKNSSTTRHPSISENTFAGSTRIVRRIVHGRILDKVGWHHKDVRRWGLKLAARGGKRAKKATVVAVAWKPGVLLHRLWVREVRILKLPSPEVHKLRIPGRHFIRVCLPSMTSFIGSPGAPISNV